MGRGAVLLFSLAFFSLLAWLNRLPSVRRHPLLRRLNFAVDFLFWTLLLISLGAVVYWIFWRR